MRAHAERAEAGKETKAAGGGRAAPPHQRRGSHLRLDGLDEAGHIFAALGAHVGGAQQVKSRLRRSVGPLRASLQHCQGLRERIQRLRCLWCRHQLRIRQDGPALQLCAAQLNAWGGSRSRAGVLLTSARYDDFIEQADKRWSSLLVLPPHRASNTDMCSPVHTVDDLELSRYS